MLSEDKGCATTEHETCIEHSRLCHLVIEFEDLEALVEFANDGIDAQTSFDAAGDSKQQRGLLRAFLANGEYSEDAPQASIPHSIALEQIHKRLLKVCFVPSVLRSQSHLCTSASASASGRVDAVSDICLPTTDESRHLHHHR